MQVRYGAEDARVSFDILLALHARQQQLESPVRPV